MRVGRGVGAVVLCGATACTPTAGKIGLAVSGVAVVSGSVIAATASGDTAAGPPAQFWGAGLALVGAIAAIPFYLAAYPSSPPAPEPSESPDAVALRTRREDAWQLTQRAEVAARAGHCDAVVELEAQVKATDLDLHDTVFLRDVAIARCLSTTH